MAVPAPLARRTRRPRAGRRLTGHGVVLHSSLMPAPQRYSVVVAKDYLKFSAAHFIAYPGFREPLHGHNYQVSVRVDAELGPDGYVLDFGLVKRVAHELCRELDERVLLPLESDCLTTARTEGAVEVVTADGDRFRFPERDCFRVTLRLRQCVGLSDRKCNRYCNSNGDALRAVFVISSKVYRNQDG